MRKNQKIGLFENQESLNRSESIVQELGHKVSHRTAKTLHQKMIDKKITFNLGHATLIDFLQFSQKGYAPSKVLFRLNGRDVKTFTMNAVGSGVDLVGTILCNEIILEFPVTNDNDCYIHYFGYILNKGQEDVW